MVGERQSGLGRDSRCEEDDAITTRQQNQSAPFTKILAERMNRMSRNLFLLRLLQSPIAIRNLLPGHHKPLPTPAQLRCIGSTFTTHERTDNIHLPLATVVSKRKGRATSSANHLSNSH